MQRSPGKTLQTQGVATDELSIIPGSEENELSGRFDRSPPKAIEPDIEEMQARPVETGLGECLLVTDQSLTASTLGQIQGQTT